MCSVITGRYFGDCEGELYCWGSCDIKFPSGRFLYIQMDFFPNSSAHINGTILNLQFSCSMTHDVENFRVYLHNTSCLQTTIDVFHVPFPTLDVMKTNNTLRVYDKTYNTYDFLMYKQ